MIRRGPPITNGTPIHLSDDLLVRLDQLATALDQPRDLLIERALTRYIEDESRQIAAISDALATYRAGQATVRPHEDVMDRMEAKIRARIDDARRLA
jgi:predicted transcriptional regulator